MQGTLTPSREAVLRKCRESRDTQERFFAEQADWIVACARTMAESFKGGSRLFVMGNGGSACDAQHITVEFMHPIHEKRRALPSTTLSAETALLTAVANDSDYSVVFERQLRLLAKPGDIALAVSTSGKSAAVHQGLKAARAIGMLTVSFTGKDGGFLPPLSDFPFVVPSYNIHRIQEAHGTLLHVLWDLIHLALGEEDIL